MLCDKKVPQIKRQIASIDKKSDFRGKDGPFRTNTSHNESSSKKKPTSLKTVTSAKVPVPTLRMHSFEDAQDSGRKRHSTTKLGRDVDVSDEEQHI